MSGENKYQQEEQLFRYLKNEMTEKERNAFEREMQRDPFLAEAVDGLSAHDLDQVIADSNDLKGKLHTGHKRKRQMWWYAAASVLILVTSGLWLFNIEKEVKREISQNKIETLREKETPLKELELQEEDLVPISSNIQLDSMKLKEDDHVIFSGIRPQPAKTINDSGKGKKTPIRIRGASRIMNHPAIMNFVDTTKLFSQKTADSNMQKESLVKHVLMDAPQAEVESSITFSHDSFEQPAAFLKVDSGKDSSLSEVVVVGYGTQKKNDLTGAVSRVTSDQKASPKVGWKNYKAYLDSACQHPSVGLSMNRVIVKLNFTVNAQGELENFEIVRSSNERYNKEAIQIILQGPAWHPKVKNSVLQSSEVKLKLVFKAKK